MSDPLSSNVLPRASRRIPKPSARKLAQSISTLTPRQKKKKATGNPCPPSTEVLAPVSSSNVLVVEEMQDTQDESEDIEEGSEIEEAEPEKLKFMSTWRASCGKGQLPGIPSRLLDPFTISMLQVYEWQDTVFGQLYPKTFNIIGLQAIASYERCRVVDEVPQEVKTDADLISIIEVLTEWHRRAPNRSYQLRIQLSLEEILPLELPLSTPQQSQQGQQSRRVTATR